MTSGYKINQRKTVLMQDLLYAGLLQHKICDNIHNWSERYAM